ncbi:MAG: hypothetical protein ABSA30_13340, partial [Candidatus Aminicenantales bacterium]
MSPPPLIAVDVGNSRIKFGWFPAGKSESSLPEPERTLQLAGPAPPLDRLAEWLLEGTARWFLGSVNRPAATRLVDWLRQHRNGDRVVMLAAGDLPLAVKLSRPDM